MASLFSGGYRLLQGESSQDFAAKKYLPTKTESHTCGSYAFPTPLDRWEFFVFHNFDAGDWSAQAGWKLKRYRFEPAASTYERQHPGAPAELDLGSDDRSYDSREPDNEH